MYVSPISTRFVRGRSTPAIRAMFSASQLTLTLLVLLIRANHAHHAAAAHDLALVTNSLYRCPNFHVRPLAIVPPAARFDRGRCHALSTPPTLDRRPPAARNCASVRRSHAP